MEYEHLTLSFSPDRLLKEPKPSWTKEWMLPNAMSKTRKNDKSFAFLKKEANLNTTYQAKARKNWTVKLVPIIICLNFCFSLPCLKGFAFSKTCLLSLQSYQILLFQQSLILLVFPHHNSCNNLTILDLIFFSLNHLNYKIN